MAEPTHPIPHTIEQVSADWLTAVLRGAGALGPRDAVRAARPRANDAFNSVVAHLALDYAEGASATAPRALLVKLNQDGDGAAEAAFYRLVASRPDHPPVVPRPYAAEHDPRSGRSYCLLEDLSETHEPPVGRRQLLAGDGVPPDARLDAIVETLARLHAYWWQHPGLGSADGLLAIRPWYRDRDHYRRHIARREAEFAAFRAAVGDTLPADLRALYERALAGLPRLWDGFLASRVEGRAGLTLTHGDCYLTQFLCPRDPAGATYLVDFGDASANLGAYDLAYLLPTFWTPAQRAAGGREGRLLRRYHQILLAHGVAGYSWDDLLTDYRAMVALMIFDPIWNQTAGSAETYWWPKLRCLTGAFRDLRCQELLDGG